MTWAEVRQAFPDRWVVLEALSARTEDGYRIMERLGVFGQFADGHRAFATYRCLHREFPHREIFPYHTSREAITIEAFNQFGVRINA